MKLWQLSAVLGFEQEISDRYLGTYKREDGQKELDEFIIEKALTDSQLRYYVASNNSLRLMPEDLYLQGQGVKIIEILSVLDAYKKYGADAITEVVDYGSYNL
ncbi:hypothetical protein [Taibaiella soli]|uniref:Uncharacterized protein n=1 Tax=Taibaiella soli TaxID=1649169 RepID=A0A2W2AN92_9BACT|nr:hypothetical protein [Taibaiella soli]PZF75032.1 hypothetical protein DN068_00315 [Taibaiella soli]